MIYNFVQNLALSWIFIYSDMTLNSFLVIFETHFSYETVYRGISRNYSIAEAKNPILERTYVCTAMTNFQRLLVTERMHDRLPAHMLVRTYICMYLDVMREEHRIRHSVFLRRSGHIYSATENVSNTHTLLTFRLTSDFICVLHSLEVHCQK